MKAESKQKGREKWTLAPVWFALIILGTVGVWVGGMIRAAISRQREFLTDASAAQFTRNPAGLAGALKKIGDFRAGLGGNGAFVFRLRFFSRLLEAFFPNAPGFNEANFGA